MKVHAQGKPATTAIQLHLAYVAAAVNSFNPYVFSTGLGVLVVAVWLDAHWKKRGRSATRLTRLLRRGVVCLVLIAGLALGFMAFGHEPPPPGIIRLEQLIRLGTVASAEQRFLLGPGQGRRFGSFEDLVRAGLLDRDFEEERPGEGRSSLGITCYEGGIRIRVFSSFQGMLASFLVLDDAGVIRDYADRELLRIPDWIEPIAPPGP